MFRSLMTIIRELYLYLTKVIFMLKHSVKLRRYIYLVMWQHIVERYVCCVQCTQHTCLSRMRNVSNKSCRENQNTHFVFSNCYSKILQFMRKCCKLGMLQMTIWLMHIACWIHKATNTQHSGCVILIAFPLQQQLRESASVLRYTHIACLL